MLTQQQNSLPELALRKCYGCFRPLQYCHCSIIPRLRNQTEILILQHRRERFHPFNTARMASAALENSQLLSDRVAKLAKHPFNFDNHTGLLYPGKNAIPITELAAKDRPKKMVVIDGTWHHAKQIMRDVPQLAGLKTYRINPTSPGNYRIRKEPTLDSLSTLEAIIAALRELEPELQGTEKLLAAFDQMIDTQIAHPKAPDASRFSLKRFGTPFNIPVRLIRDYQHAVVAYGESQRIVRDGTEFQMPIYWTAYRPQTDEIFEAAIETQKPLTDINLNHLELDRSKFDNPCAYVEFCDRWQRFLRPDDFLVTYKQSTVEMLKRIDANYSTNLVLKSVDMEQGKNGSIDAFIQRQQIDVPQLPVDGRAGRRLSQAAALAHHLHIVGNA